MTSQNTLLTKSRSPKLTKHVTEHATIGDVINYVK